MHRHFPCSCCSSSRYTSVLIAHKSILLPGLQRLRKSCVLSTAAYIWFVKLSNPAIMVWPLSIILGWSPALSPHPHLDHLPHNQYWQRLLWARICPLDPTTLHALSFLSALAHTAPLPGVPHPPPLLLSGKRSMPPSLGKTPTFPQVGLLARFLCSHSFLEKSVLPCSFVCLYALNALSRL